MAVFISIWTFRVLRALLMNQNIFWYQKNISPLREPGTSNDYNYLIVQRFSAFPAYINMMLWSATHHSETKKESAAAKSLSIHLHFV